jgi:hypothetical protein
LVATKTEEFPLEESWTFSDLFARSICYITGSFIFYLKKKTKRYSFEILGRCFVFGVLCILLINFCFLIILSLYVCLLGGGVKKQQLVCFWLLE